MGQAQPAGGAELQVDEHGAQRPGPQTLQRQRDDEQRRTSIDYPLRRSILALNRLGTACGRGDLTEAQGHFAAAQSWLEQTANLFAKHKLPL